LREGHAVRVGDRLEVHTLARKDVLSLVLARHLLRVELLGRGHQVELVVLEGVLGREMEVELGRRLHRDEAHLTVLLLKMSRLLLALSYKLLGLGRLDTLPLLLLIQVEVLFLLLLFRALLLLENIDVSLAFSLRCLRRL